jgi:hypothetical protein
MSDQPSEAPTPILLLIAVVALVALTGSLFVGITTEVEATAAEHVPAPPAPAASTPAPIAPAPAAAEPAAPAAPATPAPGGG